MFTVAVVIIAIALLPLAFQIVVASGVVVVGIISVYGKAILRMIGALVLVAVIGVLLVLYHDYRINKRYQDRVNAERARIKSLHLPPGIEVVRLRTPDGKDVYVSPHERFDYLAQGYEDPLLDPE